MKTIIAGDRNFNGYGLAADAIRNCGWPVTEIISGTCRGADRLGEMFAEAENIPLKKFPADWAKYGRAAGPKRNRQMAEYAEALILFNGGGRGAASMLAEAKKAGLRIFEVKVETD